MISKGIVAPLTVQSLRKYLDELETDWTEEDSKYLGDFEAQPIKTEIFEENGRGSFAYKGIGDVKVKPAYELGIIIMGNTKPATG